MPRFGPSIETITFPMPSIHAMCYATDVGAIYNKDDSISCSTQVSIDVSNYK